MSFLDRSDRDLIKPVLIIPHQNCCKLMLSRRTALLMTTARVGRMHRSRPFCRTGSMPSVCTLSKRGGGTGESSIVVACLETQRTGQRIQLLSRSRDRRLASCSRTLSASASSGQAAHPRRGAAVLGVLLCTLIGCPGHSPSAYCSAVPDC